jgi:hypothetical protein
MAPTQLTAQIAARAVQRTLVESSSEKVKNKKLENGENLYLHSVPGYDTEIKITDGSRVFP